MIVVNYLDELLDNILDDLHNSKKNSLTSPKTNKEMEEIFHQAIRSANIRKNIEKSFKNHKDNVVTDNIEKVTKIFQRYVGIYVFIKEGMKVDDSLFINFLVFAYNNYMADLLDANLNSLIIQMKRLGTTLNTLFSSSSSKKRIGDIARAFPDVYDFYQNLDEAVLQVLKKSSILERVHFLVKIVLFKILYSDRGKWEVQALLESVVVKGEYRYIDVIYGEDLTLSTDVVFSMFPNLTNDEIEDFLDLYTLNEAPPAPLTVLDKLHWLFNHHFLFPITQEFSRWHVGNKTKSIDSNNKSNIVKAALTKISAARNPEVANKNQLWYAAKLPEPTLSFNMLEEIELLESGTGKTAGNYNIVEDLRGINFRHFFEFSLPAFSFSSPRPLQGIRLIKIKNKDLPIDPRLIRVNETFRIYGMALASGPRPPTSFHHTERLATDQQAGSYVLFKDPGEVEPAVNHIYHAFQKDMLRQGKMTLLDQDNIVQYNRSFLRHIKNTQSTSSSCMDDTKDYFGLQKIEIIERVKEKIAEVVIRKKIRTREENRGGAPLDAICCHYAEIQRIRMMRNRRDFDGINSLSEFSSRYIALEGDQLVCKSCGVLMDVIKTMTSGITDTYTGEYIVSTVDTVLSVFQVTEYQPLLATLRQMDRLFDYKIGKIMGLPYLVGNESLNRRYRESLLRDTIDLIRIHNTSLNLHVVKKDSAYNKQKYGIEEAFSFLFAFKIDNQIMMMSSLDTDKYKRIKYNNILVYMVLFIIIDLSEQNIMSMDFKKKTCARLVQNNMGFFEKIMIISGIDGETKSMQEFPVLAFVISFFACMLVEYRVYQFEKDEIPAVAMKKMIMTILDVLNTILFIATKKLDSRSNLYRIFMSRFFKKQSTVFIKETIFDELMGRALGKSVNSLTENRKEPSLMPFPLKTKKDYTFIKDVVTRYQDPVLGMTPAPEKWWVDGEPQQNLLHKIQKKKLAVKKSASMPSSSSIMGTMTISKPAVVGPAASKPTGDKLLDGFLLQMDRFTQQKLHREDVLVVTHDFIGLPLQTPLMVKWSDVKHIHKEPIFHKNVFYYTTANQTRVYYDEKQLNLLGYRTPHEKMAMYQGTPLYVYRKRPLDETMKMLGYSADKYQHRLNLSSFIGIVRSHLKRFSRMKQHNATDSQLPYQKVFDTYMDRLQGKIEVGDAFDGVSFKDNTKIDDLLVYYSKEMGKILEGNHGKKDDVRYPLVNYILEITTTMDDWFQVGRSPINKIFEMQLLGRAYSVKGFIPQSRDDTEILPDEEENNKEEDPEGNLGHMLNDIDMEEGNFDLDDD